MGCAPSEPESKESMGTAPSKPESEDDEGLKKWVDKIYSSASSSGNKAVYRVLSSERSTGVKGRAIHLLITAKNIKVLDLRGE